MFEIEIYDKNVFDSVDIIDNNLKYDRIYSKCIMERLCLRLGLKTTKITICCIYCHLDGNLDLLNEVHSKCIQYLNKNATCINCGNFNIYPLQ